jgi:hypothetical protein
MYIKGGLAGGVGIILITWLVIAFLPRILRWTRLEGRIEHKHVSLESAALLFLALWVAVILPVANYIGSVAYSLTHL